MAGEGSRGRGGGVSPRQAGPRAGSAAAYSSGALLHDQPSDTALLYAHRWWEVPLHPRGQGSGKWAQPYALEGSVCLVLMAPTGWGQPLGAQSRLCSQGTHTWVPGLQMQAPGGDALLLAHLPASQKNNGSVAGTNLHAPILGSPVPRLGQSPSMEDVLELLPKVAAELKGS